MVKYLKITFGDAPYLIPVNDIIAVEVGADTEIKILLNSIGHRASGASEVLGYKITATTATNAAKTKEQLTSFVDVLEDSLQTAWTKPIYDMTGKLPYAITAIAQIEEEFSA